MFKWASVENEIADSMEEIDASDDKDQSKKEAAIQYLVKAAAAFELSGKADDAKHINAFLQRIDPSLTKNAQDFEDEELQVEEPQGEEESVELPQEPEYARSPQEQIDYAYKTLTAMYEKTKGGDPQAAKEYVPGVMYLRSVMLGEPAPQFFNRFDIEIPGWVSEIAQMGALLDNPLSMHLQEIKSNFGQLDSAMAVALSKAPKKIDVPQEEASEKTLEQEIREDVEKALKSTPLEHVIPLTSEQARVYYKFIDKKPLTDEEQAVLRDRFEEARKVLKEKFEHRAQIRELRQERDLAFRQKMRDERRKQREEHMQEFAPSNVRRISPSGTVIEEIPVEPKMRRKRRPGSNPSASPKPQRQAPAPQAEKPTEARLYPNEEGGLWILELPGERTRKFRDRDKALEFGEDKVGVGEIKVLNRHPNSQPQSAFSSAKADDIKKLSEKYDNLAK